VIKIQFDSASYPVGLANGKYPPEALYVEGDPALLNHPRLIAVVGTRRMSEYGRRVTELFVKELVKQDYVIVSGLARGVDRVAHETCLSNGGKTIAVLAHGLSMTYPPEHKKLREVIVSHGGLLVSEHESDVGLTKQQLILRNRIVVGISTSILVAESPKSSGTQNTAGWAAEMGKEVYVVPGPVGDPTYEGSVELIRDGCIPVSSPSDLIEQLHGVVSYSL
jgi:DNA processing protein